MWFHYYLVSPLHKEMCSDCFLRKRIHSFLSPSSQQEIFYLSPSSLLPHQKDFMVLNCNYRLQRFPGYYENRFVLTKSVFLTCVQTQKQTQKKNILSIVKLDWLLFVKFVATNVLPYLIC